MGPFGARGAKKVFVRQVAGQSACRRQDAASVKGPGRYLALAITAFCLMATGTAASQEFMAAGTLLVADKQPPALLLLVKHHSRSFYEMPGGRRQLTNGTDGERRETAHETAIREVFEETRGYLSPDDLRDVIDPSRSMRDGGFVFFLARVGRFPTSAMKETAHLDDDSAAGFREVADYAWVAVESVLSGDGVSVIDIDGRTIELRPELKSRLVRARAAGWL